MLWLERGTSEKLHIKTGKYRGWLQMHYATTCLSPIGRLTLACDGDNLVGLWLEGQKHYGNGISGTMAEKDGMPVFDAAKKWLDSYFAGEKPAISELPLRPIGGEFRQEVWRMLCEIPYGEVTTYGDIAKKMAAKTHRGSMSSRAVGGAVGHNPISIIIPCHRVVGAGGSLTGYAGGVAVKARLLEFEGVNDIIFAGSDRR
jgi:methylated-DNA-[protein]-cysteine S-methyltransferase